VDYEVEGIKLRGRAKNTNGNCKKTVKRKRKTKRTLWIATHDMKEVNYMLNNSHKDRE